MTNFDPGGFLVMLTVLPSVIAGLISIGGGHLLAWAGIGSYPRNVVTVLGILIGGWILAALVVSTGMLYILSVVLAMAGAYIVTQNVTEASYGWVIGVILLLVLFIVLSVAGIYQGVTQTGRPRGFLSRHLVPAFLVGLFLCGAVGGKLATVARAGWDRGVASLFSHST